MAIKLKKAKEKKERKDMNRSKYPRTLMCNTGKALSPVKDCWNFRLIEKIIGGVKKVVCLLCWVYQQCRVKCWKQYEHIRVIG